ncbi:MAG: glutamine-hydrolyzing carbamoyl-phosphate synthase small subunit [Saprospiraceae bacterium]|nr:glutamine-hydrolyzing carbamoyl-phosphate synthase small subunit [Saprospiraceae bacterium]HMW38111.1 glutamine-hydrolyzing carbamoyl-phosphate synthase small subunit [Saprospiraceae bacterium]HMX87122.1 glutamine-hydrolyzing carbamoyl-phosphate synthase small subunit [Saprospiraceae bacterium]HMZ38798.1 glutamine-hydrolyzing carbamoyl-phosphate synthase small subunit [Saprospiraceae bacterium]HNA63181.1 glutamine-hydrolyzing carbamoyl-phosphate synthase small subunit [Saprospiraceae bacteri
MAPEIRKAVLLLGDGSVFSGKAAGFRGIATGEICFNTGMTGYQEIFTDPSYHGQIMIMTNVHIGNYGCKSSEKESSGVQIAGLVCRNFSTHFSRLMTDESLENYLVDNRIVCIYDLDTRALVQHVRNKGAMNALISTEVNEIAPLKEVLSQVPDMLGLELASKVTTASPFLVGDTNWEIKVAALDFGIKSSILEQLKSLGMQVKVFPAKSSFALMEQWEPHAYFLSNGPGDPASMDYALQTCTKIIESGKPVFGICLGHQIMGLTLGMETYKMHQGHRGSNHPVKNLLNGRGEITAQNHGFALSMESLMKFSKDLALSHVNLNDNTVEGFIHKTKPLFSVQYHPEAGPGPHDSRYLFSEFRDMIKKVYGQVSDKISA